MIKLRTTKNDKLGGANFLANLTSKSVFAESYRTLRTNLSFSEVGSDMGSFLFTSSVENEGKTTTCLNLAYTMAQAGKKVVVVDGDLRKPGVTARFGLEKADGLSSILTDNFGRFLKDGRISEYSLRDLLTLIKLQKRSCVMQVQDESNKAELYFDKGKIVDIYWIDRPENRKLASALVQEKLLTVDEAKIALGKQRKSARRLGSILLSLGLVEKQHLQKMLTVQVMEAIKVAVEMQEGQFSIRPTSFEEVNVNNSEDMEFEKLFNEILPAQSKRSYIRECIDDSILPTEEKNLFILPAGPLPPNPSELLGSDRVVFLLGELRKKFDVIIVDSSPVIPATDALLLSSLVDGVVLIVEAGKTNRNSAQSVVERLKKADANILGTILNRADTKKINKYNYYNYYYGV